MMTIARSSTDNMARKVTRSVQLGTSVGPSLDGLVERDISHWTKWDDSELVDQAAGACQHSALIDDAIVREAITLNIIVPFRQAIAALQRSNDAKDEALRKARNKFLHYEQLHRLKCTSEGDEKADRNREMADMLSKALSRSSETPPALPNIYAEGERLAGETPRTNGAYLWTDLVGAIQTAIAEERARHV